MYDFKKIALLILLISNSSILAQQDVHATPDMSRATPQELETWLRDIDHKFKAPKPWSVRRVTTLAAIVGLMTMGCITYIARDFHTTITRDYHRTSKKWFVGIVGTLLGTGLPQITERSLWI